MPYITKTLITSEGCDALHDKRLSICLLADGFSFAQLSGDGELLSFGEADGRHADAMNDATRDIKTFFAAVGVQPLAFSSVQLMLLSDESVWVPDEVYHAGSNRQYLQLVGGSGDSLLSTPCPAIAATAVYSASEQMATAFRVAVPGLSVINQHVRMAALAPHFDGMTVLLSHWRQGRLDLAAYLDGRYVYGNTIAFADDSAALFHMLEVMKTYGLESDNTRLLMCGEVTRERFAYMRPYFPSVVLWGGNAKASGQFYSFPTYRHALILA